MPFPIQDEGSPLLRPVKEGLMSMKVAAFLTVAVTVGLCTATVVADELIYIDVARFDSDLNPNVMLVFPGFNNEGGTLILQDVQVDFRHESAVVLRADNDDPFKTAIVNGRMFRSWTTTGPGVVGNGSKIVTTPQVFLDMDDGDGKIFDPTPPDGTDFGRVHYDLPSGTHHPDINLYETNGPGKVEFVADVLLMINDLQFVEAPDRWQLEVEAPYLDVEVKLKYTYIPEPASLTLVLMGVGAVLLRRRRQV